MANTPFTPQPGFFADNTKFLSTGSWRSGSLVRFYEGQWQIRHGWERLMLDKLLGVCRNIFSWSGTLSVTTIAFGTHQTLEVWLSGAHSEITPLAFVPGEIDGTGGAGYGTGAYGVGPYSAPSTADYFPLTWSFGAFGTWLISNPRGQGVFIWKNDFGLRAVPLVGAPAECTYMLCLSQRQVMCFGCNEEISGIFNPLAIRWSDIENIEGVPAWTTSSGNNAGEYILEGGGRIVCARRVGEYVFVWTDVGIYRGTYIGAPEETWRFEFVAEGCGAIGPNAPIIKGQMAAWISPDKQFWQCSLGGVPSVIECPIRSMFFDHYAQGQNDKIVGCTNAAFQELLWLYADDRDGLECSREIGIGANGWFHGRMARTAAIDTGPTEFPVKTDVTGNVYWHEKGHSADGAALAGFIESNDYYVAEAENCVNFGGCWPDLKEQIGPLKLTLYSRENPQASERTHGPWTLSPGQARRSFRVSGRLVRVRFDFDSAPAYARGGKFEFDTAAVGGR
jgi:hypothetical protein